VILAILRAQLLSMRLRGGTRRGGAVFSAVTGLFFYGFWTFLAWGGMIFFSSSDQGYFLPVISGSLMFVMLYWQLAPVLSASFGASLDLRKLLAYPIPHGKLFLVEIVLRVATCPEMLIVLTGISAGLLRNPGYGPRRAPEILAGALMFAVTNILFSAGTRNWIERVFLRTKLKEVMLLIFVVAGLLPRLLIAMNVGKNLVVRFVPSQVAWPWAAAGRLMLGDPVALSFASTAAWLAATLLFSRGQFERSIRYDAASGRGVRTLGKPSQQTTSADSFVDRIVRFPARFLPDPIAAITEKELRTLSRIPRFRLVYAMSIFFGLVLYFPNLTRMRTGRTLPADSFLSQNALLFMSTYGLLMLGQITYWNSFGFDRSAAQGYFSWPIRFRDVLIAKNMTIALLMVPQILAISLICSAAHIPVTPAKVAETLLVMFITALYWLAMGNICSVRIPRALDPDKMNQMSNKMQALTILIAPFLLVPLVVAYWSRWFFGSELVFAGLLVVAAIIGGIFYWVGLDSAVNAAEARREAMLTELSRSEGPLSTT
jgi:ABC-2 type transport system permease protein